MFLFSLYAEIQDGHQKWRENDFLEKMPLRSANTLRVKNFVKIALPLTVSDKCIFAFYTEIQDGRQKWQEKDFWEKSPVHS